MSEEKVLRLKKYLLIAACSILAVTFTSHEIFGDNGYLARRRRRAQIESLTGEINDLKQENAKLSRQIKELRSDPQAIEKLAREQLRLGRPGDVVVTLPPSAPTASPTKH